MPGPVDARSDDLRGPTRDGLCGVCAAPRGCHSLASFGVEPADQRRRTWGLPAGLLLAEFKLGVERVAAPGSWRGKWHSEKMPNRALETTESAFIAGPLINLE